MKNSAIAGASIFSAVPAIVWSAFRFIAENDSRSEKIAPAIAAVSIARMKVVCGCSANQGIFLMLSAKTAPIKAPNIIIPSRAILIIPLLSAYIPASATISSGTVKIRVF